MKDRAREEKMRGAGLVTPDGQMVGSLQRSNSTLPLPSTPMGKSDLFPPSKSATTKNSLIMVNEMVQLVKVSHLSFSSVAHSHPSLVLMDVMDMTT